MLIEVENALYLCFSIFYSICGRLLSKIHKQGWKPNYAKLR